MRALFFLPLGLLAGCADIPPYAGEWQGTCTASGVAIDFAWYDVDIDRPGALTSPDAAGEIEVYQATGEVSSVEAGWLHVDIIRCVDPGGCDYGAADDLVDRAEGHTRIDFTTDGQLALMLESDVVDGKALDGVCWNAALDWEGWGSFEATRERSEFNDKYYNQRDD